MILFKLGHNRNMLRKEGAAIFCALKVEAGLRCCGGLHMLLPICWLALGHKAVPEPVAMSAPPGAPGPGQVCFRPIKKGTVFFFQVTTSHEIEVVTDKPQFRFVLVGSSIFLISTCHLRFLLIVCLADLGRSQAYARGTAVSTCSHDCVWSLC